MCTPGTSEQNPAEAASNYINPDKPHGEWMIVTKKQRAPKSKESVDKSIGPTYDPSNRFQALSKEAEERTSNQVQSGTFNVGGSSGTVSYGKKDGHKKMRHDLGHKSA